MTPQQHAKNRDVFDRWSFLWLVIGAGLFIFANGRWIIPLTTWLAPIFILRFTRTQTPFRGLSLVLLTNAAAYMISWSGPDLGMIPLPGVFYYLVAGGIGLIFWLPYLADRFMAPRLNGFAATLVFPLTYTSLEYINTLTNPFGSWGALGYTQYSFLSLIQLVSIIGMWGLTFLITWLASVTNWAWEQEFDWLQVRKGLIVYAGVLVLVLVYGEARLVLFAPESNTVQVSSLVLTEDFKVRGSDARKDLSDPQSRDTLLEIGDSFLDWSRQQAQAGADVVIWNEAAVWLFTEDEATYIEKGRDLARQEGIYLLMSLAVITKDFPDVLADNKAVWITPASDVEWDYLKGRPVPGEPVVAGDGQIPIGQTPFGAIASVICFDMDHPTYIRQVGQGGADVMLVPSYDWWEIAPFHTHMAAFRAIENGFSMIRATGEGLSAAFDYQGRVLSTGDYFTTDKAMVSHLPTQGVSTIYTLIGDLFAWLSIAGLMALVAAAFIRSVPGISAEKKIPAVSHW